MIKRRPKLPSADKLQMYFGDPYIVDVPEVPGTFTITQPTLGDVVKCGEQKIMSTVGIFTTNTTQYRALLWERNIDWNEITDFELFCILYRGLDQDVVTLLFGDGVDFSKFEPKSINLTGEPQVVLYNQEDNVVINETVYYLISDYLRDAFNMHPENEYTEDRFMKKWWIEKDKREAARKQDKPKESFTMQPLISACINHPGFKYNLQTIRELTICQFYDSVRRLQLYESATAVMKGMYSGMIDSKKIKPESYNWMGAV